MEKLHYNLSEEEFSKEKKILLWGFSILFFLAGIYILIISLVLGHRSIPAFLAAIPFGISLFVSSIALLATFKGKEMYFNIDNEKIEFMFGVFKTRYHLFKWADIKELAMPRRQKKVMICFNDGSVFIINLTWLQKKKSETIRKNLFHAAREKDLIVKKVNNLKI